jgi:hypothetical protein
VILTDGFLDMPQFTEAQFVTESLSWTSQKLVGIVCDDPAQAVATLGPAIVAINLSNGRDVRVFDADEDTMNFLRNELTRVPVRSDKIFDYTWVWDENYRHGTPVDIPENVQDLINLEYVRKDGDANNFIGAFFIKINEGIEGIDKDASEIVMDYTYHSPFVSSNARHRELRREMYQYYIYNQDESFIYDFKTFND